MKSREYWNIPSARKNHVLSHSLPAIFIYFALGSIFVFAAPESLLVLFVYLGAGILLVYRVATIAWEMNSHPICRLTDEFITLSYDRKIVPWEKVNRIIWRPTRHKTIVVYKVRPKTRHTVLSVMHERPVFIDGKWMKDENTFYEDLKNMCQKHSITFLETDDKETSSQYVTP